MKNVTYNDIADFVKKDVTTVQNWKQKQPMLLDVVKIGSFCKKNGLDIDRIKKIIDLQEQIKGSS